MPATGAAPPNGAAVAGGPSPTGQVAVQPNGPVPQDHHSDTPLYKKWWFWCIVAVGVFVVYEVATTNSNSNGNQPVTGRIDATARDYALPPDHGVRGLPNTSGLTLFHF